MLLIGIAAIIVAITYVARFVALLTFMRKLYKKVDSDLILALKQYLIKASGNYSYDNKTGLYVHGEPNE